MKNPIPRSSVKRALLVLALAACCNQAALAQVGVGINVTVGTPPPPPRVESVPVRVPGKAWVPGYWGWDGYRYVWVEGHWEVARAGYVYEAPVWVQGEHGWRLHEGGWRPHKSHPHGCPPGQAKKGNC